MTALEKNVASLEMARKMQDAGIDFACPQRRGETTFVWVVERGKGYEDDATVMLVDDYFLLKRKYPKSYENAIVYKTPTITEMLERLPDKLIKDGEIYHFQIKNIDGLYYPSYFFANGIDYGTIFDYGFEIKHKTPEQALAELCLWCRKEGYI